MQATEEVREEARKETKDRRKTTTTRKVFAKGRRKIGVRTWTCRVGDRNLNAIYQFGNGWFPWKWNKDSMFWYYYDLSVTETTQGPKRRKDVCEEQERKAAAAAKGNIRTKKAKAQEKEMEKTKAKQTQKKRSRTRARIVYVTGNRSHV